MCVGVSVRALRPVVQQPFHQTSDSRDQRDPALPPRLPLNLLQQAAGQTKRDEDKMERTSRLERGAREMERVRERGIAMEEITEERKRLKAKRKLISVMQSVTYACWLACWS